MLLMKTACILQRFVIVQETFDAHSVHTLGVFNPYVKVPDEITREVILCQLKEQPVLIDRIRMVNQHIDEADIAFRA